MASDGCLLRFGDGSTAYEAVVRNLRTGGHKVSPRGMECRELTDVMVVISRAEDAVPLATSRQVSQRIGATEYAQLLAGVSSLTQLDAASGGRFSQFADDGVLRGAYGPRVRHQLPEAVSRLAADPDSRQAVVSVWDHDTVRMGGGASRDVPCTMSMQFRIRRGELEMTVLMRSSDAWLGIPYDWWQFSRLQMTVAWALRVPAGSFTFFANSLHLYEGDIGSARALVRYGAAQDPPQPPAFTWPEDEVAGPRERMLRAQFAAGATVLGGLMDDMPGSPAADAAAWHAERIRPLGDADHLCTRCFYVTDGSTCRACGEQERRA